MNAPMTAPRKWPVSSWLGLAAGAVAVGALTVGARHDDGMVLIVAVVVLVVVDRARVLRPQFDLVAVDLRGLQEALGRIDQVGIDRHPVQRPGRVGEEPQSRELAAGEFRIGARIGEILLGPRIDFPERVLGRGQGRLVEEPLNHGEAAVEHLGQILVRNSHGPSEARASAGRNWEAQRACVLRSAARALAIRTKMHLEDDL